jgi:hypothetical protein
VGKRALSRHYIDSRQTHVASQIQDPGLICLDRRLSAASSNSDALRNTRRNNTLRSRTITRLSPARCHTPTWHEDRCSDAPYQPFYAGEFTRSSCGLDDAARSSSTRICGFEGSLAQCARSTILPTSRRRDGLYLLAHTSLFTVQASASVAVLRREQRRDGSDAVARFLGRD